MSSFLYFSLIVKNDVQGNVPISIIMKAGNKRIIQLVFSNHAIKPISSCYHAWTI